MLSTSSQEVVVLRPPSPHLGNFSHLFDDFLKRASDTEPRIDVSELNPRLDAVGTVDLEATRKQLEKQYELGIDGTNETLDKIRGYTSEASSARTVLRIPQTATPRKSSPRLNKAARGLLSGSIQESKPSPLQGALGDVATPTGFKSPPDLDAADGIPHSSPETSDTVMHQQSVFDQTPWQYVSETTPLTSPDAVMFAQSMQSTPTRKGNHLGHGISLLSGSSQTVTATYDYSAVGLSGFQAVRYHASSSSVSTQSNLVYSQSVSVYGTQGVSVSGAVGSGDANAKASSANGLFRYHLSMVQPFPGAELYSVEAAKSGVDRITPHYMCTKDDKMRVLEYKLQKLIKSDRLTEAAAPTATSHVHVFVDLSNITIGFYDCLKASHNIPITRRMKAPKFSFDHLALILERGRNVEKRVVAGSLDSTYARKWPTFMQEAKELDYEMCIMQRVAKAVMPTSKYKRLSTLEPEWTASDANSSSEETFMGQLKQGEQGVDEVLHLKMLQSVVDDRPGTAVLATGDAAEAEFSDGFKRNVERLLNKGWNVEIIGWTKGISKAWREPEFVAQYGDRVRVIELDPFVEEIFGVWFGAPGY